MRKRNRTRLTPNDWARAALRALARGGVDAVAVEPIAADLGATKGSFYWHFDNRDALIEAALELWEKQRTDAVIEALAKEADPARRLRLLIEGGFERGTSDRVEIALLANPSHGNAMRTLRRVAARRIDYLADQLEAIGWGPREARDRAVLLAYIYIGRMQLAHVAPKVIDVGARQREAELVLSALVEPAVVPLG